jgi:hypothetical protein
MLSELSLITTLVTTLTFVTNLTLLIPDLPGVKYLVAVLLT